eukprot:gb/GFBE01071567.1/.p1 GENE.gb/GFBE01071567.1/~~gb/GFBE01071567.1/.p1  ORF type:complete len:294 (+),score=67.82 gb/GFBE01071567.1/:1-882(+)
MAVYFDAAPNYDHTWPRDSDLYLWEEYEEPAFEGQSEWFQQWPQDVKNYSAWDMKHQLPWDMKSQSSYDEYAGWQSHQAQQQAQTRIQRSPNQPWETSMAVFGALPTEPKEILVVNSTSSGSYASLCRDSTTADVVAFDAEWVPDFGYGSDNPISVLQLAFPTSKRVYVIQLGPLGKKLPQEVQLMLVNPDVLKCGFAVNSKDSQKLIRTGIAVTQGSMVDVQERSAASMGLAWGAESSLSLRRAASELLGCELLKDKRCACSDWSSEQLTPEQVRYAALDAWVALRLYYLLH